MSTQTALVFPNDLTTYRGGADLAERAKAFCETAPYRLGEYAKRSWGGQLHSLCSYQGKLKPSIAHFMVAWFTEPGDRVLDPLAGVGTIPLEARRQGRVGLASDLSPLADSVCRAKLEPFEQAEVWEVVSALARYLQNHELDPLSAEDSSFGLNGPISTYFHPDTLREILHARMYFLDSGTKRRRVAMDVVKSSIMHILHGNRPYALSRRSHPVTPFAPTGPVIYRPLIEALTERLRRILPPLLDLNRNGEAGAAYLTDFRRVPVDAPVDAVITSPPFSKSLRFWSSNWMRMWFAGWSPDDFKTEPNRYLEIEQRKHFDAYGEFATSMHRALKPGGTLIMHLGETAKINMVDAIRPMLEPLFDVAFVGRESVVDTESHGLTDKGATVAHWYVFATART